MRNGTWPTEVARKEKNSFLVLKSDYDCFVKLKAKLSIKRPSTVNCEGRKKNDRPALDLIIVNELKLS